MYSYQHWAFHPKLLIKVFITHLHTDHWGDLTSSCLLSPTADDPARPP